MSKIGRHWACTDCSAGSGVVEDSVNVIDLADKHQFRTGHFVIYSLRKTDT